MHAQFVTAPEIAYIANETYLNAWSPSNIVKFSFTQYTSMLVVLSYGCTVTSLQMILDSTSLISSIISVAYEL